MATENGTTVSGQDPAKVTDKQPVESKGKGKAVAAEDPTDVSMDEDDDDSEEEVSSCLTLHRLKRKKKSPCFHPKRPQTNNILLRRPLKLVCVRIVAIRCGAVRCNRSDANSPL